MKLIKDGKIVELTEQAHIDAYLSSGWKKLDSTTTIKSGTEKTKKE